MTRRVVETLVNQSHQHLAPSEFIQQLSENAPVTESTVYRTLDRLVAHGIVERSQLGDGVVRYYLSALHHEHLFCEHCGAIIDAPIDLLNEAADRARALHNFVIRIGASSLPGTCDECRYKADVAAESRAAADYGRR